MRLLRRLSRADLLTLGSVALSIAAFRLLLQGERARSIGVMALAIVGDHLDGIVARRFGASPYGKLLDSFFDALNYLTFPALYLMIETDLALVYLPVVFAMVAAGLLRLARFTQEGFADEQAHHYAGMPVFYLGFAPLLLFLGVPAPVVSVAVVAAAWLMIGEVPFAKPRGVLIPAAVFALAIWLLVWA